MRSGDEVAILRSLDERWDQRRPREELAAQDAALEQMAVVHAQRARQHCEPGWWLGWVGARHRGRVGLTREDVAPCGAARHAQVARAPQIEQVDARAGKGLRTAQVQIIEDRHLQGSLERGLGAGVRVKVPVLEAQQPGEVHRRLLEAVRPGTQIEPAVADVELHLDFGPDRELHAQLAQVDHLDAGVEVAGPGVLEAEAAARRDAAARGDGVGDLDVRLDRRAGDVSLHADDETHLDLP